MTDAAALARFEALVQAQTPAETPWQPVTDYSFEARAPFERPQVERLIAACEPALVYDIGCGPGHLVRLLEEAGVSAIGFDLHPDGDAVALDISARAPRPPADLVICREVLEHLTVRQLVRAVRHLCAASSRFVYLTTRFAHEPDHLLDVDTADALDPTHITMLHQDFLRVLFVLEGFTRRADLEQALDWKGYGRVLVYERA